MAAQEYYQGSIPMNNQQPAPPPPQQQQQQQQQQTQQTPPYPLFDGPPPPYSPGGDRPQSQPPPQRYNLQNFQQQPSNLSQEFRPAAPRHSQTYAYPPEKLYPESLQAQGYRPPPQQQPYLANPNAQQPYYVAAAPAVQQPYSNYEARESTPQFRPARSPKRYDDKYNDRFDDRSREYESRSRGREREHRDREKVHAQRQKSKGVNTFLGAGGGALIGDLIFPGLGTLGGALLGGVGGHEYGKSKGKTHYEREPRRRRYSDDYDEYRRGRR